MYYLIKLIFDTHSLPWCVPKFRNRRVARVAAVRFSVLPFTFAVRIGATDGSSGISQRWPVMAAEFATCVSSGFDGRACLSWRRPGEDLGHVRSENPDIARTRASFARVSRACIDLPASETYVLRSTKTAPVAANSFARAPSVLTVYREINRWNNDYYQGSFRLAIQWRGGSDKRIRGRSLTRTGRRLHAPVGTLFFSLKTRAQRERPR